MIAYARNGHTDKFGIPRQSRDESPIVTRIVFEPEYAVAEALRGIVGFSHLWILWGFSEITRSHDHETTKEEGESRESKEAMEDWSPTVRPPRLGGNKRVGVFATRSPFRPNPIGMSSVRLLSVQHSDVSHQMELVVSGADLMDGTPIYDIKPYLSYSDSHPEAVNGFAEETKDYKLNVEMSATALLNDGALLNDAVRRDIAYILSQDPRPAYQDDPEREYKMDYAGYRITFVVEDARAIVKKISKIAKK